MSKDIFPSLGTPTIYVAQPYGGMDAQQMESYFTYYYEYHFLYITGIEHVESKSIQGASLMKLQFHPKTNMDQAMSETIAYVNRSRAFMPPGTPGPFVTRFDAGSVAVGQLVFSTQNPNRTVGQMQDAALNQVRPLFATLEGVSAPPPFGGSARTIVIQAKPERLRAYGISADELIQEISQSNSLSPSGNIAVNNQYPIVTTNSIVKNVQDLATLPLRVSANAQVYLRDVADVLDSSDTVTSYALVNNKRTVYMPVTKRSDASTLSVVESVKANLAKFKAACPEDIDVTFEMDQSPWISHAIRDLLIETALGALLAGLMVWVFLCNVRGAWIVILHIPVSLAAALAGLWICGHQIHLMTLGGLTLAVGVLIDEATVAIETIFHHWQQNKTTERRDLWSGIEHGITSTIRPRFVSMLCLLSAFAPCLLMEGTAKALFLPLALAVGLAMIASYLLSSTLTPVLAGFFYHQKPQDKIPNWLVQVKKQYQVILDKVIKIKYIIGFGLLILSVVFTLGFNKGIGKELFPVSNVPMLQARIRAAAGTRIEQTEKYTKKLTELVIAKVGEKQMQMSLGLVGVHAPNYPVNLIHQWNSGPEEAVMQYQLKSIPSESIESLQEELRVILQKEIPEIQVVFEPADILSKVMSLGANMPIEVHVSGKDFALIRSFSDELKKALAELPFLRDVSIQQMMDYPSIEVQVDRQLAGIQGVKMNQATKSLVAATASSRFTVPNYWADLKAGTSYSLQVQVPTAMMNSIDEFKNLPIQSNHKELKQGVLLKQIAKITEGKVQGQYDRYNMARMLTVQANLYGKDLQGAVQEIEKRMAKLVPPKGVSVTLRGQVIPLKQLSAALTSGIGIALLVIVMILVANFQNLRASWVTMTGLPLVMSGSLGFLWIMGQTLNTQSGMGLLMSLGISLANAVLLVDMALKMQVEQGMDQSAILHAAQIRLRPILMTSLTMIAGMLPMAIGQTPTAGLAIAVIGGILASLVGTLILIPCSYFIFMKSKVQEIQFLGKNQ